jgi:ABC-2 type transport system permease protein
MTSPTSSFKLFSKAVFWVNLKRFIWLPILNLLVFVLTLPFVILSEGPRQVLRIQRDLVNLNSWADQSWFEQLAYNPFLMVMLIGTALLWAALLYSYLNEGKATTFFHSLPFNRTSWYWNLNLTGAIGMLVPLFITVICCLLVRLVGDISILFSVSDVLLWALSCYVMELVFFSSAVFVGTVTGLALVQPIFTVIIHTLPMILYALTAFVMHQSIYGFPNYSDNMGWIEYLPIVRIFAGYREIPSLSYLTVMAILTAILFAIGLWSYHRRPMERTGDIIVFSALKPLFKYGLTYCTMLAGGLAFSEIINKDISAWMLILWSVVGYCLAEMLLQKSIRILNAWRGLAIYLVIIGVFLVGCKVDILGYQRKIPDLDQVAAVYLNGSKETYAGVLALEEISAANMRVLPQLVEHIDPRLCFQETANIAAMQEVHRELINHRTDKETTNRWRGQKLTYVLKSGRSVQRQYSLNLTDYPEQAKALYESVEYKDNRRNITYAQAEDMQWIRFSNGRRQGSEVEIFSAEEINGLLAALRQDITSEDFESMEGQKGAFYYLEYRYKMPEVDWQFLQQISPQVFDQEMLEDMKRQYEIKGTEEEIEKYKSEKYDRYDSIAIPGNYKHTLAWIKANGYWEKLQPEAKNFAKVRLYKGYNTDGSMEDEKYAEEYRMSQEMASSQPYATKEYNQGLFREGAYTDITDQAVIQQILTDDSYEPYYLGFGESIKDETVYCVDFYAQDHDRGYVFTGYYYQGLPDVLKDQVAKLPTVVE